MYEYMNSIHRSVILSFQNELSNELSFFVD